MASPIPVFMPLAAGGAVDVRGVAEQEGAALAEMLRHPVMHMIGRKPIHLLDLDLEVIDRPIADVLEFERIGVVGALVAHGADQARSALLRPAGRRPGNRPRRDRHAARH